MIGHTLEMAALALLSVIVALVAMVARPQRATCPHGWYVEGVRPSGRTQCRPSPPRDCGEPVPPFDAPCPSDERAIAMEIYCTSGMRPIVVNERIVGCQR